MRKHHRVNNKHHQNEDGLPARSEEAVARIANRWARLRMKIVSTPSEQPIWGYNHCRFLSQKENSREKQFILRAVLNQTEILPPQEGKQKMKTLGSLGILLALLAFQAKAGVAGKAATSDTEAFNYFLDPQGNVGFDFVQRVTDPTTGITTTTLSYSFCVQTTAPSCLEGSGIIPNSDFTGNMSINRLDVLKLQADTTIPGFDNHLCLIPDPFNGCNGGTTPATGGIVSLTFTKTRAFAEILVSSDLQKRNGLVVLDTSDTTNQFSGSVVGTVIGSNVNLNSPGNGTLMTFDTVASGKKAGHSKALENWLAGQALGPQTLRRLQVLTQTIR